MPSGRCHGRRRNSALPPTLRFTYPGRDRQHSNNKASSWETADGAPPERSAEAQKTKKPAAHEARPVRNICVYCGSNPGINPAYAEAARTLGRRMAEAGIGLVYGGGGLGLMGELARTVLAHGGRVTGIIPGVSVEEGAHAARRRTR